MVDTFTLLNSARHNYNHSLRNLIFCPNLMQRIILTGLTLLAVAAAAQAQNTATLSQNGNDQSATFSQTGNGNVATVRQLTGSASSPNVGNVASVTQTANASPTNQVFIDQLNGADYNQATIQQSGGSNNRAAIEQNGGNGFRSGGSTLQAAGLGSAPLATDGNYGAIRQVGSGNNQTTIYQNAGPLGGSGANYGNIVQLGSNNGLTVIDQQNNSTQNRAQIEQGLIGAAGTGNSGVVRQSDNSSLNLGLIKQAGESQTAEVLQTSVSAENEARVDQSGQSGLALIYQTGDASNNQAEVTQVSNSAQPNAASIYQTDQSYYNQATVLQAGNNSVAQIIQNFSSANNVGIIEQGALGNNNLATIQQTYAWEGGSAGSTASYGSGSTANIQQNLTTSSTLGNVAVVEQGFINGLSPVDGSTIVTKKSVITIGQENDVNVAQVQQGGENNQVTATQSGYSTIKGIDNGQLVNNFAQQIGNNNTLTVTQAGSASVLNQANIYQVGSFNTSTVIQTLPGQQ